MEECLQNYEEEFCFQKEGEKYTQDRSVCCGAFIVVVLLRKYDHCPILHPIRGFGEVMKDGWDEGQFVAVVCTMFYLTTMVYDLKMMGSILNIDFDRSQGTSVEMQDGPYGPEK